MIAWYWYGQGSGLRAEDGGKLFHWWQADMLFNVFNLLFKGCAFIV
jgi:hypothetical protein